MGEVSKLTGLAPHMLRNWEKTFAQLKPKKNSAGNRIYKDVEVQLIFKIKGLLDSKNYTSEGVKYVLNGEGKSSNIAQEIPASFKKDLTEMKIFLTHLLEKL